MTKKPNTNFIFNKKIKINYSDLDFKGQLKALSILNFLQDSACVHASELGISGFELLKKNFAWVILKYQIKIIRLPMWNDEIFIKTWRIPCKNLYELRYFNIKDKNGTDIINAAGTWIMVKKESCRPVRLSRFLSDIMFEEKDENLKLPFDKSYFQDKELKLPETIHCELPFKVRMHNIDLNQHVNNSIYVEWAMETIPQEFPGLYRPEKIDVSFHKAAVYGDSILSKTEVLKNSVNPVTIHSIMENKINPVELARVNIAWTSVKP